MAFSLRTTVALMSLLMTAGIGQVWAQQQDTIYIYETVIEYDTLVNRDTTYIHDTIHLTYPEQGRELVKDAAHIGNGACSVVCQGIHENSDAMRAVSFVGD